MKNSALIPADIKRYQHAVKMCPTLQRVTDKIDTPYEFKKAFKVWFDQLNSLEKEDSRISKSQILAAIREVIEDYFGYH